MRILVALGGNALLRRGEPQTIDNQLANVKRAAEQIARVAAGNQLVVAHGNGPQVGLLALQATAGNGAPTPLDVLDAESEGMIGYLLAQELANRLPRDRRIATLLTRVEVDRLDPAFDRPTKPIGPVYPEADARRLAVERGWRIAPDGAGFRHVVASPLPKRIVELEPIRWLLERDAVVIAAGGGGIPVAPDPDGGSWSGVEAVIDKDRCSALLAAQIEADLLLIATDVDAVYVDWNTPASRPLREIDAREPQAMSFAAGSMGPKVQAACEFVLGTGRPAVIGALGRIVEMIDGRAGTRVVSRP
ncbi:carbamate kinase [Burkholderia oklahomensis]|uniref:carbamate kinase n=1 Tax=Burkholderia oklahomensis TaxID=342113 RepID=UPI00016A7FD6|nr:carbamate kinase [Burkholderia oklahomensis]AJX34461.1 carbamate kinase [Burkholderia oklahomensis C6786]AOI48989.1 carbamate kinase [Burkholderia oklahomensis C6786]KUY61107.1 carbamate kinase [Burkholderia oklahomensis C6786]MBI0362792.1 carbamate kinase [Burkholderia oklahomensis]SUY26899.1 Carbamate kinase 1 [Burkholderia oklahomensis]